VARNIYHAVLSFKARQTFAAGQYLKLWLNPSISRCYSIASSPRNGHMLEVFVGCQENESAAQALLQSMETTKEARVTLPFGQACHRTSNGRPVLLLAGGTGYGYVRSILFEALLEDPKTEVTLLWAARDKHCIFDDETLSRLAARNPQFTYQIWLEDPADNGRAMHGDILAAIHAYGSEAASLGIPGIYSGSDIYIGGGPAMVKAVRGALQTHGADPMRVFSD
jgi:NAD(P)H-flavin reductase